MIKHIEFIGPMGAGKSTIANGVLKKINKSSLSRYVHTAFQEKRAIARRNANTELIIKKILKKIIHHGMSYFDSIDTNPWHRTIFTALGKKTLGMEPFLQYVFFENRDIGPGTSDNFTDDFLRLFVLMNEIIDFAIINQYGNSKIIVHDEFFIQRGVGLAFNVPDSSSYLRRYCELVPVPDLLVHVSVEPKTSAERIITRGRNPDRHLHLISRSIELSKISAGILQTRGATVLQLNGMVDIPINVDVCINAIEKIFDDEN